MTITVIRHITQAMIPIAIDLSEVGTMVGGHEAVVVAEVVFGSTTLLSSTTQITTNRATLTTSVGQDLVVVNAPGNSTETDSQKLLHNSFTKSRKS
jgi:hypothetical protein